MSRPVPNGRLENYTLIVALTLALGLDAVVAGGTLFSTLDASLSASQAAGLGSLPHLGVGGRPAASVYG
jgi:hypothetical protein